MGPVGSSKSTACIMQMCKKAMEQKPHNGKRQTRWLVMRNTYPELKSTTIKTFLEWMPFVQMKYDAPITGNCSVPLPDGTVAEMEFIFLALERPDDVGRLKSFEATGAWMNEAGEMAKAILDMAAQRVGRFPAKKRGGPTWSGVLLDTNPPDDDSWWFRIFEEEKPKGYQIWKQPGGLIERDGKWEPNPDAENIENLPGGHEYYLRQVAGKTREWIRVFLGGQYGTVSTGKPVFPEYNDEVHCKEFDTLPGPILLGFDYGLTPACVVTQVSPRGQLLIVDELCSEDMGIRQFARDVVKPYLSTMYPRNSVQAVGDPAGMNRSQTEERTCFMELADEGIPAMPAITNDFVARREAVAKFLTRMTDGKPALMVHPRAKMIRRGFNGAYNYERVLVTGTERYKDRPNKNKYSHPMDAVQYAALHANSVNLNDWSKQKIVYGPSGIV